MAENLDTGDTGIGMIHANTLNDTGDSTLLRYKYQFTYTAILAIQMFKEQAKYKEIYCEYREDVILVLNTNRLIGFQIKTRHLQYGPFLISDDEITKTLIRFIEFEKQNPDRFDKFVIVASCSFAAGKRGLPYLISLVRNRDKNKEELVEKMISGILSRCASEGHDVSKNELMAVLMKLHCINGPSIEGVQSKAIEELRSIEFHGNNCYDKLDSIIQKLISTIFQKSSIVVENSLPTYREILEGDSKSIHNSIVIQKRIDNSVISSFIKEEEETLFVKPMDRSSSGFKGIGSKFKMVEKMTTGNIDQLDIAQLEILCDHAASYLFEQSNKQQNSNINAKIEQIELILSTIAIEVRSRCRLKPGAYGTIMLHGIEDNIRERLKHNPSEVFNFPYEILKGMIGMLTADCKIWFSEEQVNDN